MPLKSKCAIKAPTIKLKALINESWPSNLHLRRLIQVRYQIRLKMIWKAGLTTNGIRTLWSTTAEQIWSPKIGKGTRCLPLEDRKLDSKQTLLNWTKALPFLTRRETSTIPKEAKIWVIFPTPNTWWIFHKLQLCWNCKATRSITEWMILSMKGTKLSSRPSKRLS